MARRKKILFPATARTHLARQKLLLEELKKHFNVHVSEYKPEGEGMALKASKTTTFFLKEIRKVKPDLLLIRGDRFELLPIAMMGAYMGIPIAHIEGGELSSVIDNRVRYAITHLSDYHFCTNEESHARLVNMGVPTGRVWNYGSLDVEFASKVKPKRLIKEPYILVAYHCIPGENDREIEQAIKTFTGYKIVKIEGNKDYGKEYPGEQFPPEDYINLMRYASCCIGNSSSLLKEASILGVPVVNIGSRQDKRLRPRNLLDVPCINRDIQRGIRFQLTAALRPDKIYYQPNSAKNTARKIKDILENE